MVHRFIVAAGIGAVTGLLAGCAAGIERNLQYADSLARSAEQLREHGHVQNADALEQEARRKREATLSSLALPLAMIETLFIEPAVGRPTGFAGPIETNAPVSPRF